MLARRRLDALAVAAAVLGCYGLSAAFELHEVFNRWLARYERWQADELPLTLLVLSSGLAWYAWRRHREARQELQRRQAAEQQASALLAHNRGLAQRLIAVQEGERLALARELHDELGQRLSALLLDTDTLCRSQDTATQQAAARRADDSVRGLYHLVSGLLRRLRPANLDTLGLVAALQELCEAWEERSGVACVFHHEGLADEPDDAARITVYRVAQESLTNVRRHAQASSVKVWLARTAANELQLSVQDDGRGLPLATGASGDGHDHGLGLLGAAERAAAVGGELQVQGLPGSGVRVELRIPMTSTAPLHGGWQAAA